MTRAECELSLVNMPLDEYEALLSDFYRKEKNNKPSKEQVVQMFSAVKVLEDVKDENSLTRKAVTYKILCGTSGSKI